MILITLRKLNKLLSMVENLQLNKRYEIVRYVNIIPICKNEIHVMIVLKFIYDH